MAHNIRRYRIRELSQRSKINEERKEWYERIKGKGIAVESFAKTETQVQAHGNKICQFFEIAHRKPTRTRHNRICHPRRRISGYSHSGHHDIQAENPRALECHNNRNSRSLISFFRRGKEADVWFKKALMGKLNEGLGQSTVEYALLSAAFLAIVLGLGALSDLLGDGVVVSHAISAASHGVQNSIGGAIDVFSF